MATEKFHHMTIYGEIVAPKFRSLPMGFVRKMRKVNTNTNEGRIAAFDITIDTLEELLDEDSLDVFDQLTPEEFDVFQKEWMKDSGINLGKLLASSRN